MPVLYDTRTVHPLDRYDYYRAASATELAPISIHGRAPSRLLAVLSVARIGDFEIGDVTWSGDSTVVNRRTERLIRACDPECYRLFFVISGTVRGDQAGNRLDFCAHDMSLYDLSQPFQAMDGIGQQRMQAVVLSFPRALVPVPRAKLRPLFGTLIPGTLPGRSLITQFLVELARTAELTADPGLADVLRESVTGLIRVRLGLSSGISPHTRQTLWMRHLENLIRRHHGDPKFGIHQLAREAHISLRYLHKLLQGTGHAPMQLLKRLRLDECYRSLQDPGQAMRPIKSIIAEHGYCRPDQFARDFKQVFDVSPKQVRRLG